jgi:hypothetical protein
LPLWLDASERIDLKFKDFADRGRIKFYLILFALMLDNDFYALVEFPGNLHGTSNSPGIVAMFRTDTPPNRSAREYF